MKERRVLAIGSPKRTILGWTVSFLHQSNPARTKIIEEKVSGWQPYADLENRGTDSIREPRSPEPEDTDLTCLPDPNKIWYHSREAGRSYGTVDRIYRKYLDPEWNSWYPFQNAKDFKLGGWMLKSGLTKGSIDEYLQPGLDDDRCTLF